MEESVQHIVMAAIQHLLTSCMPSTPVGTSSKEVEELQDEVCCVFVIKTVGLSSCTVLGIAHFV